MQAREQHTMDKEEQLLRKRIRELASVCQRRDIPTHTDFLNLNEQTIFHSMSQELAGASYRLTGGYSLAERKIVCFLPSYTQEEIPPISCVEVAPLNARFAEDLTHRDYLGAVMNLGIERSKVGDILIEDGKGYIFALEEMAPYIADQLSTIRRTSVTAKVCPLVDLAIQPRLERMEGSVASERLDNILAFVYRSSRSRIVPYIEGEKVFVNGKLAAKSGLLLKPGDIVSVRGLGKFRYCGVENETKKGRLFVAAERFV